MWRVYRPEMEIAKNLEVVIEFHHHTDSSRDIDPTFEPLCQLVAVADSMANSLGMGLSGERVIGDRLFEVVGLGEKRYAELLEEFRSAFEEQKQNLSAS